MMTNSRDRGRLPNLAGLLVQRYEFSVDEDVWVPIGDPINPNG